MFPHYEVSTYLVAIFKVAGIGEMDYLQLLTASLNIIFLALFNENFSPTVSQPSWGRVQLAPANINL